ncbi:MAG TPA: polysaccharide deacetylase family protein [Longimicrobiales bacterium]|nr:polysaccharide deacetylase family protein [Longimicrobiales bacterium]
MLRVLTYHRIQEPSASPDLDPSLVSATPEVFRRQMEHLRRWYEPVGLDDVMEAFLGDGILPRRAVHVTVDDGYRDFLEIAWPILRELDIPVTLFVPTAYPGERDRSFWWDRLHRASIDPNSRWHGLRRVLEGRQVRLPNGRADKDLRTVLRLLPHDAAESVVDEACMEGMRRLGGVAVARETSSAVLTWDELRALKREGVSFGAHTRHHVALPLVDAVRIRREIRRSCDDLTRELGDTRWALAYPYGMCSPTVARIAVEEGCLLGFTCDDGLNVPGVTDPLRLCRTNITIRTSPGVFAIRMLPWCARVDRWRHRHKHTLPVS